MANSFSCKLGHLLSVSAAIPAASSSRRQTESASFQTSIEDPDSVGTVDCQLLLALHSADGNFAAALTLDGKTRPHDAHRYRKRGSRVFAQVSRQQRILSQRLTGARPSRRRLLQSHLSRLPIHLPIPRAPLPTLWRRQRDLSRN